MNAERGEARRELERRIDAVEAGYEFLLAYAAQGRERDRGAGGGRLREFLEGMRGALAGLGALVAALMEQDDAGSARAGGAFLAALEKDAATAQAAVSLVLSREDIGSQLIDNLNASIHLRALLTDLFLVDELLKSRASRERPED
ncbi:MAG TPA: hypothetical protein VFY39_10765 [Gammaproteobacteria bacterium]|nr:hypothetical protein [Gammaproteobacteria bacterium]